MHRTKTAAILVTALATAALGGCATKGFVREQVSTTDTKIQGTQAQVDQQGTAIQANQQHLAQLDQTTGQALQQADAATKLAQGKFTYATVLADDSIIFSANKAVLTDEAKTRLTDLATKLKTDNRNVYLEIQGYEEPREYRRDHQLGTERAEAVRRFLSQQGVALNRMATISYGTLQPMPPVIAAGESATASPVAAAAPSVGAAPTATAGASAATGSNRRVIVLVMS